MVKNRDKNVPYSLLSNLTDTRSREVHRERGHRHISNILQVRDTGKETFTKTHLWHCPIVLNMAWIWLESEVIWLWTCLTDSVNTSRLMFQSMCYFSSTAAGLQDARQILLIHKQKIIVHIQASQSDKRTCETRFVAWWSCQRWHGHVCK